MDLEINIYNSNNRSEFESKFSGVLKDLDIYYHPSFLSCDAKMQGGEYEIFTAESKNGVWIYPYILLPIKDSTFFDICSPYGYAGPFCNELDLFKNAEIHFNEYIKSKSIVTEFVRYHYDYNKNSESRFSENCVNIENRTIVLLHTNQPQNEIWENSFSGTNRNLVRKIEKENYSFKWKTFDENDVIIFQKMYEATMRNSNASDFYFFDSDFYKNLIVELGEALKIAFVEKDGIIFSTSLFFLSGKYITYYLSARNLDFPKINASNFMLSKVSFWASENGFHLMNFGGGLSNDENDSLFKFKRNFSKEIAPFFIGKKIHNSEKYAALIENYKATKGSENYEKVKNILQFYRI